MSAQLQDRTSTPADEKGRPSETSPQTRENLSNGSHREFSQWGSIPVYGNSTMTNQGDYQFPTNYYPFPTGNSNYGLGENPWGMSYAPPPSHQPTLGSPPSSGSYAMPAHGGDFFGAGSNYGFAPAYNFFDYGANWGTSIMTHQDPNSPAGGPKPPPPQDYYGGGTSGYRLIDGSGAYGNSTSTAAAIRELDDGLSKISMAGGGQHQPPPQLSNGPPGPQSAPSSQILRDFGQVVGPSPPAPIQLPQAPPKPLTWADKVKQAPKDNIVSKPKSKVPIGGVGSRSKETGSIWSGGISDSPNGPLALLQGAGLRFEDTQPGLPMAVGNGWGTVSSGQVVQARKPASIIPSDPTHHLSNGTNGSAHEIENKVGTNGKEEYGNGVVAQVTASSAGKGIAEGDSELLKKLKRETNPAELTLNTRGARYFVIKSYSEDDVHRSIKYSIWCSTDHGNKRLDQAYKERAGKGPIYLFFSVNASGHFCGIAQMISPVDYNTHSEVWAQDKWKGLFHVKWLYVKDVPNGHLRHIRLENNENKPVTNSRDTQEVPLEKGRQVLRLLHQYRHTTSLFDDFGHYEKRQLEEDGRKNH